MWNPILITGVLLVAGVSTAFLAPSPEADQLTARETLTPVDQFLEGVMPAVTEVPQTRPYSFHLRLWDAATLLYSTWANESGELQDNASDGAPINTTVGEIPSVLAPLASTLRAVPDATYLRIHGVELPPISPRVQMLSMTQQFDRRGTLTFAEAAQYLNHTARSGNFTLAGLPVKIEAGDGNIAYEILAFPSQSLPVPRASGLFFTTREVSNDTFQLTLFAPTGDFTSAGCQPVPGTIIPPGHYVLAEAREDMHVFDVYPSPVEYRLNGRVVDIELTILQQRRAPALRLRKSARAGGRKRSSTRATASASRSRTLTRSASTRVARKSASVTRRPTLIRGKSLQISNSPAAGTSRRHRRSRKRSADRSRSGFGAAPHRPHVVVVLIFLLMTGCLSAGRESAATFDPRLHHPSAFLWNAPYSDLSVIVRHAAAFEPSEETMEALLETLREVTGKRQVTLLEQSPLTGWMSEARTWTNEDLENVVRSSELGQTQMHGRGDTAILEIYYLDGRGPDGATGMEYLGRPFVFSYHLQDVTLSRPLLERVALMHEVGHALGLVNCGIPMVTIREDPESPCHSLEPESVMSGATASLKEDPPGVYLQSWRFDEHDMADFAAHRETGRQWAAAQGRDPESR